MFSSYYTFLTMMPGGSQASLATMHKEMPSGHEVFFYEDALRNAC
jgi:hypothetical protein